MAKNYKKISEIINWVNDLGQKSESLFNRISDYLEKNYNFKENIRYAPYNTKRLSASEYYSMRFNVSDKMVLIFLLVFSKANFTNKIFSDKPALCILNIKDSSRLGYTPEFFEKVFQFFSIENLSIQKKNDIISGSVDTLFKITKSDIPIPEKIKIELIEIGFEEIDEVNIEIFLENKLFKSLKQLGLI